MAKRRKAARFRSVLELASDFRKMSQTLTLLKEQMDLTASKIENHAQITDEVLDDHEDRLQALETKR